MATAADVARAQAELHESIAKRLDDAPTGAEPGYHPGLGATVLPNGKIRYVSGGGTRLLFSDRANASVNSGVSVNLDFNTGGYDPGSLWASSQFTAPRDGWFFFSLNIHATPTGGNIAAGDIVAATLVADSVSYRIAYFEAYNTPASAPAFIHLSGAQTAEMTEGSHATIFFENLTTRTVQIVSGEHCSLSIIQVV